MGYDDDSSFWNDCFWYIVPTGCGFCSDPLKESGFVNEILTLPVSLWKPSIDALVVSHDYCYNVQPTSYINEVYDPPAFGEGSHEIDSKNGDFTLRFTISVSKP